MRVRSPRPFGGRSTEIARFAERLSRTTRSREHIDLQIRSGSPGGQKVRDEGVGMSPEIMARLFEPFFIQTQPVTQAATILLVEDEAVLREVLCETLGASGYTVLTASDGEEAVRMGRLVQRLDLLVTDVRLPKLSGPAAEELIRTNPGLPVVYLSGYGDGLAMALARSSAPKGPLIQKPFTSRELLHKVHEVLDRG